MADLLKETLAAVVRDKSVPRESGSARATRVLGRAALLFLAYSIVQVFINGIVLDETVIAAQIITGAVRHEAGHPHAIYYTQAFSLPHYLSALAFWIYPSVEAVSAVRNVLVLFVTIYATFLLAWVLTRRPLWAYIAAAILIAEANLRLAGLYPMATFPAIYSNGNFGLHYSILIVALLLGGMYRSSALLLGLLPAIHAMFAVILWPWALLLLLARGLHRDRALLGRILLWGGLGIAVCAALYGVIRVSADHRPPVPPYDVTANGPLIREQFRIWTDGHRRPIPALGLAYLGNAVAFFVLGALLWMRARARGPGAGTKESAAADLAVPEGPLPWQVRWILVLGAIVWVYVFGAWLLMTLTGSMPDWLFVTMPSRFSNIAAALAPALTAVALAGAIHALDQAPRRLALLAIGAGLCLAAAADSNLVLAASREFLTRNCLFILWGMLLGLELVASRGRQRVIVAACLLALSGVLLTYLAVTKVALYMVATALATVILLAAGTRLASRPLAGLPDRALARWLLAPAIVLLFAGAMPDRLLDPVESGFVRWDMQSPDTRTLREWFGQNARRDEPVLSVFIPNSELQLKTGQPLLFEQKTLWIMSYIPSLAPVIATMAKDLYGVDYEDPAWLARACDGARVSIYCLIWIRGWQERSPEEWQRLGAKYRFRFVLSATRMPLGLPVAVPGEEWTLYQIPRDTVPAASGSP